MLRDINIGNVMPKLLSVLRDKFRPLPKDEQNFEKSVSAILTGQSPPRPLDLRKYGEGIIGLKEYVDHLTQDFAAHTWVYLKRGGPVFFAWQATTYMFASDLVHLNPERCSEKFAEEHGYFKGVKKLGGKASDYPTIAHSANKATVNVTPYSDLFLTDDGVVLKNMDTVYILRGFVMRLIKAHMTKLAGATVAGTTVSEFMKKLQTARAGRTIRIVLPVSVAKSFLVYSGPPVPTVDFFGRILKKPMTRLDQPVNGPRNSYGYALL